MGMARVNNIVYWVLALAFFSFIAVRTVCVPITHDECATVAHYINYSVWDIMMYPDSWPNNHILNTLAVKGLCTFLPKEQWVVRLPNLLSFWIFACAVFGFLKLVIKPESRLFIAGALLFYINLYLLDFFGLCRGYGMSTALVTASAVALIKAFMEQRARYVWWSLVLAILGAYANFTTLVYFAAVCVFFQFFFFVQNGFKLKWMRWPHLIFLLMVGGYVLLIATPILKMQADDQFKYWNKESFVVASVEKPIHLFNYGSEKLERQNVHREALLLIGIVLLTQLFWWYRLVRDKWSGENFRNPVFLSNTLLVLTGLMAVLNNLVTGTPYLTGRTALFYYPLLVMFIATLLAVLDSEHFLFQSMSVLLIGLFSVWHVTKVANIRSAREWWFDENTFDVMAVLRTEAKGATIDLRTNWLFYPSFYFYVYTGKAKDIHLHDYNKEVDVNAGVHYYYVMEQDLEKLKPRYDVIKRFNDRYLLKRKETF